MFVAVLSAFASLAHANAEEPRAAGTSMEWFIHSLEAATPAARPAWPGFAHPADYRGVNAGATVKGRTGWSASLFVSYIARRDLADDPSAHFIAAPVVNATVARNIDASTRLIFDVFNVLDRTSHAMDDFSASRTWSPATPGDNFLFHPDEPRGFRIRLRKTF